MTSKFKIISPFELGSEQMNINDVRGAPMVHLTVPNLQLNNNDCSGHH